jgi:hypothetical protein
MFAPYVQFSQLPSNWHDITRTITPASFKQDEIFLKDYVIAPPALQPICWRARKQ